MTDLHFAWLEASILIPLAGALGVGRLRRPGEARAQAVVFSAASFLCTVGEWLDFDWLGAERADDCWHLLAKTLGREPLVIDGLITPMLPLLSLLFLLTIWATLPNQVQKFSFGLTLLQQALVLALFSCQEPWGIVALACLGTLPPYFELRSRGNPTRVYLAHMLLFVGLLVGGWSFVELQGPGTTAGTILLAAAVLVRTGIVPLHCWMRDLFEHVAFGTALVFVAPVAGAYLSVRLLLPVAPSWVLSGVALLALTTAVYAAAMATIQREARRLACCLFLSHSALVIVGLQTATTTSLTGALCVWMSVVLSMGGFGLTLRALEARCGRLSMIGFHGLYEHAPNLAMCFALTGLASIGFPGTFGFVGSELLVDGAVEAHPHIGVAVVLAAALNGIAVVRAYFQLFTGTRYTSSISLRILARERFAVLALAALILIGGLVPQPGVASRHHAAEELLRRRVQLSLDSAPAKGTISKARPQDSQSATSTLQRTVPNITNL